MFTGIVQGKASIRAIKKQADFIQLQVELPEENSHNIQIGASIALNGTCLTVTSFEKNLVSFDLIMETLRVTNLGNLKEGDQVNFERAAKFGDEIGGHLLSGHIHHQVKIAKIERPENNCIIWFETSQEWLRYVFAKGFIGLNGCSLTIGEVKNNLFNVYLIPETLSVTTFGELEEGDSVNMEIDAHTQAVVDTVEQYMSSR
ncbi:riboflavin synthase [Neptuniibacter caesariensis]|uniref:Riboflavin synthase n=1 Tax=Neptuniibacter caesariensis TaxID=207954 RepID=A0A7U8GQZ7_NEPCE|nr:riboflavin synthase [Neptuniibacter caesariensis]EAR59831.1 riboflavin synthase subunit alpha [Neptuniibacter caesariensis]